MVSSGIGCIRMVCVAFASFVFIESGATNIVSYDGTNYGAWCDGSPMSAGVAQSRCVGKGNGWNLASIPSSHVDAMIRGLSSRSMWTGGTYVGGANKYKWKYGRYAGKYFSNGPGASTPCVSGMYCNWSPDQPDRASCDGAQENNVITGFKSTRQWDDMWDYGCGGDSIYKIYCYVCEQNPCLESDCVKGLTRPRGYFPDCTCTTVSATLSLSTTVNTSNTESPTGSLTWVTTLS